MRLTLRVPGTKDPLRESVRPDRGACSKLTEGPNQGTAFTREERELFELDGMLPYQPFGPVDYGGKTLNVSQGNNVYIFPGNGLGAIISEASEVTDSMFAAAAHVLAGLVETETLESGERYPPLTEIRAISRSIATAVAREACDSGVGRPLTDTEIRDRLDHEVWNLDNPTLVPA